MWPSSWHPCVPQCTTVKTTVQTELQLQQQRGQGAAGGHLILLCTHWLGERRCITIHNWYIEWILFVAQVDNWSVTRETTRFYGDRQQRKIFVVRQGCHKRKYSPPLPQDQRIPVCLAIIAVYLRCSILGKQRQMKPPGAVVGLQHCACPYKGRKLQTCAAMENSKVLKVKHANTPVFSHLKYYNMADYP